VIPLLLTLGAVAWVGLLVAVPVMPDGGAWLHTAGSIVCHQIPERSFAIGGHQLPVCARCLGLYGGASAGAVVALVQGATARRDALSGRTARWTVGLAAVPTALTLLLEWSGLWAGSNTWRCAAGVVLGAAAAIVVMRAVAAPSLPAVRA